MARRNIADGPFSFELYSSAALATTAISSFPIDNGVNASLLCWCQIDPMERSNADRKPDALWLF